MSVILTTRDRPRLLALALAYYGHQTYSPRELIVVDDGDRFPVARSAVDAVGGRLIQVSPGTPLGTKLNRGVEAARGTLCQKMDDDDWYAPRFLDAMVAALRATRSVVCQPSVAVVMPFLFFDVARWEVRRSIHNNLPGATLLFAREDWRASSFRAVPCDEDVWFLLDQTRRGASLLPVRVPELFLAVRHQGGARDRGHTWLHQGDGRTLEDYLLERPLYPGGPEALLPEWALAAYRDLRRVLAPAHANARPRREWGRRRGA